MADNKDKGKRVGPKTAVLEARLKKQPFPLQYAQEIWAVEACILGAPTPMAVGQNVVKRMKETLGKNGLIKEIGVSITFRQTYYVYVHFDWPPTSKVAIEALSSAFAGLQLLSLDLLNPFTIQGKPRDDIEQKHADFALEQIRNNQHEFVKTCANGRSFYKYSAS